MMCAIYIQPFIPHQVSSTTCIPPPALWEGLEARSLRDCSLDSRLFLEKFVPCVSLPTHLLLPRLTLISASSYTIDVNPRTRHQRKLYMYIYRSKILCQVHSCDDITLKRQNCSLHEDWYGAISSKARKLRKKVSVACDPQLIQVSSIIFVFYGKIFFSNFPYRGAMIFEKRFLNKNFQTIPKSADK